MNPLNKAIHQLLIIGSVLLGPIAVAGEQPTAILHAHDESYRAVTEYVCDLAAQGYTHLQIAPPQESNDGKEWWNRYQPVDFLTIKGKGTAADLKALTSKAHSCGIKVIADVVFNHMSSNPKYSSLNFPNFKPSDFHPRCDISYSDGNTSTERRCWLNGDLPDLDQGRSTVLAVQKAHLKLLVDNGVDGFRFDAAKHMEPDDVRRYVDYINTITNGQSWNYLEVIDDNDSNSYMYTPIAAVTDFVLCDTMKNAFSFGGSLSSLRVPQAINDSRSVTFGINHDSDPQINPGFPKCQYANRGDAMLANAYVLARESGTPLILGKDNLGVSYLATGVRFRATMRARNAEGKNTKETVLAIGDPQNLLMMERGSEGFFVVNKAASPFDTPVLDLTLTNLEGCYRELRNNFTVAIERRQDKKFTTRWGTWQRGGLQVQGRDALYFARVPFQDCASARP
jgi:alpha-amylase